jgi:hypothetical protein
MQVEDTEPVGEEFDGGDVNGDGDAGGPGGDEEMMTTVDGGALVARYLLYIEYNGTRFKGIQRQGMGERTVSGTVEARPGFPLLALGPALARSIRMLAHPTPTVPLAQRRVAPSCTQQGLLESSADDDSAASPPVPALSCPIARNWFVYSRQCILVMHGGLP